MRNPNMQRCCARCAVVIGIVMILASGCATVELPEGERTVTRKTRLMGPGFLFESETHIESETEGSTRVERATSE